MPIYAYLCQGCGHQLEKLQRISDAALSVCPQCGQPMLKKQLTAAAFQLKGTGWYETDFKTKKPENKADSKTDGSDKATDSKTPKPETKSKDTASTGAGNKDAA